MELTMRAHACACLNCLNVAAAQGTTILCCAQSEQEVCEILNYNLSSRRADVVVLIEPSIDKDASASRVPPVNPRNVICPLIDDGPGQRIVLDIPQESKTSQ